MANEGMKAIAKAVSGFDMAIIRREEYPEGFGVVVDALRSENPRSFVFCVVIRVVGLPLFYGHVSVTADGSENFNTYIETYPVGGVEDIERIHEIFFNNQKAQIIDLAIRLVPIGLRTGELSTVPPDLVGLVGAGELSENDAFGWVNSAVLVNSGKQKARLH